MKFPSVCRSVPAVTILLIASAAVLLLAACAPDASAAIISPNLGAQLAAAEAGGAVALVPTPVPPKLAELPPEAVLAGVPADLAEAIANGNIDNGPTIAAARGCIGCHQMDPANQAVAPTWYNMGDTAVIRIAGVSPGEYLHQSIVAPNSYIVPNFLANVMPQNYSEQLSTQELGDVIAYLLAQNGQ